MVYDPAKYPMTARLIEFGRDLVAKGYWVTTSTASDEHGLGGQVSVGLEADFDRQEGEGRVVEETETRILVRWEQPRRGVQHWDSSTEKYCSVEEFPGWYEITVEATEPEFEIPPFDPGKGKDWQIAEAEKIRASWLRQIKAEELRLKGDLDPETAPWKRCLQEIDSPDWYQRNILAFKDRSEPRWKKSDSKEYTASGMHRVSLQEAERIVLERGLIPGSQDFFRQRGAEYQSVVALLQKEQQ